MQGWRDVDAAELVCIEGGFSLKKIWKKVKDTVKDVVKKGVKGVLTAGVKYVGCWALGRLTGIRC